MCDVVLAIEELCLETIDHHWLGVLLEVALFGYAFIGLAIVCDDYLVPALETLCEKWHLSEDLAGATFMAFGSGAPEVILSTLVTIRAVTNKSLDVKENHGTHRTSGLGVSTILGSGWIAYLLIPACCTFLAKRDIHVRHGPLLRDISFYLIALAFLYNFGIDRTFYWGENVGMICGYVMYILVVMLQSMWQSRTEELRAQARSFTTFSLKDLSEAHGKRLSADSVELQDGVIPGEPEVPIENLDLVLAPPASEVSHSGGIRILAPLKWTFQVTHPSAAVRERHFVRAMLSSFVWVGVLSWIITVVVSRWIKLTSLSSGIFGVSLVAIGGQIPDAIQSVSAARKGHGSMALGNALGSQNLNIFLGLGIPWLFCSLEDGIELTHATNLYLVGKLTFAVVILFALFTLLPSITATHVAITRCTGTFFLVTYVTVIMGYTGYALA